MKTLLYLLLTSLGPLIGISNNLNEKNKGVSDSYIVAIQKAGGIPVLLPPAQSKQQADAMVEMVDAVLFTGGEDVNPSLYGENKLFDNVKVNERRDTSDILLVLAAYKSGKPLMGICRGCQVVNVALGGSLYQDLPQQVGSNHKQKENYTQAYHPVVLKKGSKVHGVMCADTIQTNSCHHQAIKKPAKVLKVTGKAPDGVVEITEGENIFCVQFHPEGFVQAGNYGPLPLFKYFVDLASDKSNIVKHRKPISAPWEK